MGADLLKMTIFANFPLLPILPPSEWMFTFQLYWSQALMFSFIFKGFPKLKVSMTGDLRKMTIFANFPLLHILPPNERIFTFQLWYEVLMFCFISKGFPKNKKKSFRWPRISAKWQFLLISHLWIFCLQKEWIFTFQLIWLQVLMFSFIFKVFPK